MAKDSTPVIQAFVEGGTCCRSGLRYELSYASDAALFSTFRVLRRRTFDGFVVGLIKEVMDIEERCRKLRKRYSIADHQAMAWEGCGQPSGASMRAVGTPKAARPEGENENVEDIDDDKTNNVVVEHPKAVAEAKKLEKSTAEAKGKGNGIAKDVSADAGSDVEDDNKHGTLVQRSTKPTPMEKAAKVDTSIKTTRMRRLERQ